jgi:hypothetical protein
MHDIRSSILSGQTRSGPAGRKRARAGAARPALDRLAIRREEARTTDHRAEDRHRDLVEESVIYFRRRKRIVRVINVSSRGAMIESDVAPRIGEEIDILFTRNVRTRCAVRWVRGGRIGLEFTEETIFWDGNSPRAPVFRYEKPAAKVETARYAEREARQRLVRSGTLYWSGISVPVRLSDISAGGARVETDGDLRPGDRVELDLGEAGTRIAEIRWSHDGQIGLRFAEDFDLDALGRASSPILARAPYMETEPAPDSPWAVRFAGR